jgi:phage gpG-like protein
VIGLKITGTEAVLEKLGAVTGKVRVAAKSSLDMWALELAGYIKADKLSGQVLNRRSGNLSSSVHPNKATDSGSSISAGAAAGLDVPYAKIHEYGGLIPAHQVVAINAKALCFSVGGVIRFAKSVQIPDVTMPERSYMRSSLREKAPDGIAELRAAVKEAIAA